MLLTQEKQTLHREKCNAVVTRNQAVCVALLMLEIMH